VREVPSIRSGVAVQMIELATKTIAAERRIGSQRSISVIMV